MNCYTAIPVVVVLSCLAGTAARGDVGSHAADRLAARFVRAEIFLDGAVVLRGSTSDDGGADVDAVWDYQRGTLAYAPTAAFAALGVPADAKEWVLELPTKTGEAGGEVNGGAGAQPATARGNVPADAKNPRHRGPAGWTIEVVVDHGGEARTRSLRLVRGRIQPGSGGDWYLHPDEVARLFGSRLVHRDDVVRIDAPARRK